MRAIAPILVALAGTLAAVAAPAPAATLCRGRYDVQGAPVHLGSTAAPAQTLTVRGGALVRPGGGATVDAPFVVELGDCTATAVTRAPRTGAFVLRAKFEGCGARPRFRLRLAFDADCRTTAARLRAGGRTVATFAAALRAFAPGDPGTPTGDPTPTPVSPGDGAAATPTVTAFSPLAARRGDTIALFGSNLDRGADGVAWSGTPPYVVTFASVDPAFGRLRAVPTFVSATELRVAVPPAAVSGTIVLAERRSSGAAGATIAETAERLVVVTTEAQPSPPVPTTGTPPATENRGRLVVQETQTSLFDAGAFLARGSANEIGAFLDTNDDGIVDLIGGANDVPYPAFPVRSSEFDFSVTAGRGYFPGANAMLWVFFEGGDPAVLEANDRFFVVHLAVDLAARTARPVAMLAGSGGDPGLVMLADQFSEATIEVAQPGGGVGALRGRVAAVPSFLQLIFLPSQPGVCPDPLTFCGDTGPSVEQRLWANGVTIDFDVPLFADNG